MTLSTDTKRQIAKRAQAWSQEEIQQWIVDTTGKAEVHKTSSAALKVSQMVDVERMFRNGMAQADLQHVLKGNTSYVSKACYGGRTLLYAAADVDADGNYDGKLHDASVELATYWSLATEGRGMGSFVGTALEVTSPDPDTYLQAVERLVDVFGSVESLYKVAKGSKVHPDDPRAQSDPEPEGEPEGEPGDDDDDEGKADRCRDMLRNAVTACKANGVSETEIAAIVAEVLG